MQRLLITMALLGLVAVEGHGQNPPGNAPRAELVPPPVDRLPEPEPAKPEPEWRRIQREERARDPKRLQQETARVSERYNASRERVRAAYDQVIGDFERIRSRGGLDPYTREYTRVKSLHAFLVELRMLGEKVISDEASFKAAFDTFQSLSGDAALYFQDSADLFRRHQARAEFPETKATYQKAADWYDARAKQAKHEASFRFPVDFDTEQRRLKEFVQSLRVLEETVRIDPASFRGNPEGLKDLASFETYYLKLGELLQSNTNQILENITSQPQRPQASRR